MDSLLGKDISALQDTALSVGLPKFAGRQIAEWLYKKRVVSFDEMTNISQKGRAALSEKYTIGRNSFTAEAISRDGTKKYLFPAANSAVETVYIPDGERATLCVSTQAGCRMRCQFCMTGTLGFHGNLSVGEIINQVFSVSDTQSLTNIVFMGEGEPCDNIDNVLNALQILTADWGCGWSPRRITVSSVGYIPGLKRLLSETDCHIAISLHNPFPAERAEIMPVQKVYSIEDVITLLRSYDFRHQRRLSFEYILFKDKNDTLRHANQLRRLLNPLACRINLIRFHCNPQDTTNTLQGSDLQKAEWMRDYLTENGITTTIRKSRGEDILAACGMLVNSLQNKE